MRKSFKQFLAKRKQDPEDRGTFDPSANKMETIPETEVTEKSKPLKNPMLEDNSMISDS